MWGNLVENLGLKEGLAEFTEQFNKDAKTTIANTQFAKERGIDVAKLDEWGQQIQEQAINKTAELHERTIGRAVETLAQDETMAQLLELKREADEALDEQREGTPEPKEEDVPLPLPSVESSSEPPQEPPEPSEPVPRPVKVRSEALEASAQIAALEGRLAELTAVSDDAFSQADDAKQQVLLLKRAVEEKDAAAAKAVEARESLEVQLKLAQTKLEESEASFLERLQREVSQKEQELLDEVAYLRKAGEAKERRVQDLQAEKAALERRLLVKAGDSDVLLEAHTAIARAFGDMTQHPCLRLLDEPMLKFMAVLFKQPLFRRMFFGATVLLWFYVLLLIFIPGGSDPIHL